MILAAHLEADHSSRGWGCLGFHRWSDGATAGSRRVPLGAVADSGTSCHRAQSMPSWAFRYSGRRSLPWPTSSQTTGVHQATASPTHAPKGPVSHLRHLRIQGGHLGLHLGSDSPPGLPAAASVQADAGGLDRGRGRMPMSQFCRNSLDLDGSGAGRGYFARGFSFWTSLGGRHLGITHPGCALQHYLFCSRLQGLRAITDAWI